MKRMSALLLALLMLASLSSCGSSETAAETTAPETAAAETRAPETAAAETAAATAETQTAVSEWTEYGSLDDAEAASGITYSFGEVIDCGAYYAKQYMAKAGMLEVTYYDETETDTYVIRQANLTDADISEDVTEYSHDFLEDDCGVTGIRLRGTQDQLAVCSFNYGDYSYVIYPGSMSYPDTFYIIGEMTGVDTVLYAYAEDSYAPAPDTDAYDEWYAASAEFDDEYYEPNDYGWGDGELDDEDLEPNDAGWTDEELDDEDLEANDYGWGELDDEDLEPNDYDF